MLHAYLSDSDFYVFYEILWNMIGKGLDVWSRSVHSCRPCAYGIGSCYRRRPSIILSVDIFTFSALGLTSSPVTFK